MTVSGNLDFNEILNKIDRRFEKIDHRFDKLDQKLEDIKIEIAEVKGNIKTLDAKVEGLGKRVDNQEFLNRIIFTRVIGALLIGVGKVVGLFSII
jgi:archaellum component FlaC